MLIINCDILPLKNALSYAKHFSFFGNKFNIFSNTGAQMLDSIDQMTF